MMHFIAEVEDARLHPDLDGDRLVTVVLSAWSGNHSGVGFR
jgi:hypothetical protein